METHENAGWPFFVKNLENVQGDERDVIFVSTTFGKAPETGKVRANFGPISRPEGGRRLNVLVTRARRRIELFTSMLPEDVRVDEATPLGTKMLRDYLDFGLRGVLTETSVGEREPDSDFEVAVGRVLQKNGYEICPQLGVAGFFIDIAVRNPDRSGEYLAAIECDGATYHGARSARDRDRIRQEILESLGWKGRIYRIWSTDWFYDPRRETAKLLQFLEQRRESSSQAPEEADDSESPHVEADFPTSPQLDEAVKVEMQASSDSTSDVFVEIGDRVTYCFIEETDQKNTVMIVDSESNPKLGLLNEQTPVAKALLGLSVWEVGVVNVAWQAARQVRVLRIRRGE